MVVTGAAIARCERNTGQFQHRLPEAAGVEHALIQQARLGILEEMQDRGAMVPGSKFGAHEYPLLPPPVEARLLTEKDVYHRGRGIAQQP